MLDHEDRRQLEELKAQVQCERAFTCVHTALSDLCQGKYYPELEILECLETPQPACKFAHPFGCTQVCSCALRKFIARNFDRWSVNSTTVLRQRQG